MNDLNRGVTALYARLTREDSIEKGLSIPNQKRRFEELASLRGWHNTIVYEEHKGVSGELPAEQRPGLSSLLKDANDGKVHRVVVRHLDRLGRGDSLGPIVKVLQGAGVELWTFDGQVDMNSAAGRFITRIQAAAGAFETERGGERVREAKRGRAKDGIYIGPAPYGYTSQSRMMRQLIERGLSKDEARIQAQRQIPVSPGILIDEAEAEIVRLTFDMFLNQNMGCRSISVELNSRGILRRGRRWYPQHITKLLHDPKVAGFTTFDEESYELKRQTKAPPYKQTWFTGKHEAIITLEQFNRVRAMLGQRGINLFSSGNKTRIYPLSSVLYDMCGHKMKGKSCQGFQHNYYVCGYRARNGADNNLGGCDAPNVRCNVIENCVRGVIAELLSSPDVVMRAWDTAKRKMVEEAPERTAALNQVDNEIVGLEKEREAVFAGLRNVELDKEQYQIIADRAKELNLKIKELREARKEIEQKVIPVQFKRLSQEQVSGYLSQLQQKLELDPSKFRELILLLKMHHDLKIKVSDKNRFTISLSMAPSTIRGDKNSNGNEPKIALEINGSFDVDHITNEEWAARENGSGHFCACGCGGRIRVLPLHRATSKGIPKHIPGHHKMNMTAFVETLNAEGYLSVAQAAAELHISENTLRRAEDKGWIKPEWRQWGERYPMRTYNKVDLPMLKKSLLDAGFRFKADGDLLSTREAAKVLGLSETTLRSLEKRGLIPSPSRDTAGRRNWKKSELDELAVLFKERGRRSKN